MTSKEAPNYANRYIYIMSNMTRDNFIIGFCYDLKEEMTKMQDKLYRRENVPNGKRQCHFLVFYEFFERPTPAIMLHGELRKITDVVKMRAFIRKTNPKWRHLQNDVLNNVIHHNPDIPFS